MKSPEPRNKAQRKVEYKNYDAITMSRNYHRNCQNYRDTAVSKKSLNISIAEKEYMTR